MPNLKTRAILALAASGLLVAALPATAATASHAAVSTSVTTGSEAGWNNDRDYGRHRGWQGRDHDDDDDDRYEHRYEGRRDGYRNRNYYDEPVYRNTRVWRGDDGRAYCRRGDGTTGLLIGGAAGALLGREVAGRRGDRTMGLILGAAGGALIGRSIDRNNSRCR
jgi:hypothetical protein